jgi:hypothetical protein
MKQEKNLKLSVSLLQRKFKLSYDSAKEIMQDIYDKEVYEAFRIRRGLD